MALLSKLKSLLGLVDEQPERRETVDVTVEHEPASESERAVKEPVEPTAGESAAAEPPSEPTEPATADESAATETTGAETEPSAAETESAEDEEEAADATVEQTGPAAEPVDTIKGVGPSYAAALDDAGVETVGDLVDADADELADATGLSAKRIGRWIDQAEARTR